MQNSKQTPEETVIIFSPITKHHVIAGVLTGEEESPTNSLTKVDISPVWFLCLGFILLVLLGLSIYFDMELYI
eukprot:snap_masked-scaffold_34-processed-gene-2.17-mRNA-1 protein AED:1.00 eAED:1.00 QI:0/-1/0/0/-1/1/1/0/72